MDKFFIVGCPRSGTTVLQQALGRHSQVVVPAETKYFYYFYGMPGRWQQKHLQRMRSDLDISVESKPKGIHQDHAYRELFDQIADRCIAATGKQSVRWFGDKTPEHTTRLDDIRRVYPDCPIIFIFRDPRDVVVSLRKVPWIKCGVRSAAAVWTRYARVLNSFQADADDRVMLVRYEDLVIDPTSTLAGVCRFLSIEFEDPVSEGAGETAVIPPSELAWKSHSLEKINPSRIGRWRTELDVDELAQVERMTGALMGHLGYRPETPPPYRLRAPELVPLTIELARMTGSLTYQCLLSEALAAVRKLLPRADVAHQTAPQLTTRGSAGRTCGSTDRPTPERPQRCTY